jgi:hypothetical protein
LIVGRRAVLEQPEAAQEVEFLLTEFSDFDPAVGASQHRQQALQQHLVQLKGDLTALAWIVEVLEMFKPVNDLIAGQFSLGLSVRHVWPLANQRNTTDSAVARLAIHGFMQSPCS